MKRNYRVNVTVRALSNSAVMQSTYEVGAQSECEAKHLIKAKVERQGGQLVQIHWCQPAANQPFCIA